MGIGRGVRVLLLEVLDDGWSAVRKRFSLGFLYILVVDGSVYLSRWTLFGGFVEGKVLGRCLGGA